MIDFNDAASIRAWLAIEPQRHRQQLRALWKLWPAFRHAIEEAVK